MAAAAPGARASADVPASTAVLIVGGGPVGLVTAILLQGLGVPCLVVERRHEVQPTPAAHVVNARTFEILRSAGIDGARVAAACAPPADGAWVRWVTSLTGEEWGRVPFERQDRLDELDAVTPTPLRNLSQHRLEPILRDHVPSLATGVSWRSSVEQDDGIVSVLRDEASGEERHVHSRWLVAADGAGSRVRSALGVGMDGPARLASFVTIHAEADLRHRVAHRPATLYWLTDPATGGTFVAHDPGSTWVYMHPFDPDSEDLVAYDEARCAAIFRRALGTDDPFTVRTVSPWTMTCQVATTYRRGRVFLVGDAAHRFPPTGGLGLNTGVADTHNLVWKLAAVEHGWADAALLDTYEAERRPVAQANAAQSLANAVGLLDVAVAHGAGDDPAASRRAHDEALASPEGRARVRAAVEAQAGHFDLLGLQLGAAYAAGTGAVVDDGSPPEPVPDPVRDFLPSTRPGSRLPHAWMVRGGERCSTLDLVRPGRCLLLTSLAAWGAVAAEAGSTRGAPVDVVVVGRDATDPDGAWGELAAAGPGADGALLVRPDQHVAWRVTAAPGPHAVDDVAAALDVVAGRGATVVARRSVRSVAAVP